MSLELNLRMVFRRTGELGILCDPDRKYAVSLNRTGMEIYELLRECDDLETLLTRFGGDDENKRQDAEKFLMLLTKSGCLSGYLPADSPELPPLPSLPQGDLLPSESSCNFPNFLPGGEHLPSPQKQAAPSAPAVRSGKWQETVLPDR
jgi:hypothetical protein